MRVWERSIPMGIRPKLKLFSTVLPDRRPTTIRWGTITTLSPAGLARLFSRSTGYDLCTGIGTPLANLLLPALAYSATPGTPDLVAAYDSGSSNTDNITNLNNHDTGSELQFTVSNTTSGATVTIYADGTAIGSATASGALTTITTTGSPTLADGTHVITARQTVSGLAQSVASPGLTVTIDTTPPTVTANQAATKPTRPAPHRSALASSSANRSGDFIASDVTLGGTAGATQRRRYEPLGRPHELQCGRQRDEPCGNGDRQPGGWGRPRPGGERQLGVHQHRQLGHLRPRPHRHGQPQQPRRR